MFHEPVLLKESIEGLAINENGIYVDATYGGGGHARLIVDQLKEGKLFAFDQDAAAEKNVISDKRMVFINQNFRYIKKMLRVHGITHVNGILADLGVSSFQIDTHERGFAHRLAGMLDMRMDQKASKRASVVLNTYSVSELQKIFSEFGEVRNAKTLAEKIIELRRTKPFTNSEGFVKDIEPVIKGNRNRYLSQVFQALRIEVNDELNALREFLNQSKELLMSGGRLVVISYHSLEDRIVKNFIRSGNAEGIEDKDDFGNTQKIFDSINKKPVEASAGEVRTNPRARSAKMRVAEKK